MKQIIGLVLQTIGYIILSWSVLLTSMRKYINFPWEKKPIEIKLFLFLLGIRNNSEYNKLFSDNQFPIPESFSLRERLILNSPIIALIFIIIGVFLNF